MDFPSFVSFTLTNACNLRCAMCGQWSPEGYIRSGRGYRGRPLELSEWKSLADEIVRQSSIAEIWNGESARHFRERRRQGPLGACPRCVARHLADVRN